MSFFFSFFFPFRVLLMEGKLGIEEAKSGEVTEAVVINKPSAMRLPEQ